MPHRDRAARAEETLNRTTRLLSGFEWAPGPLASLAAARREDAARALAGLWDRAPSTWSQDGAVHARIAQRLGWLDSPRSMADALPRIRGFADGIRAAGFSDVVLLGMGGSSLAPEVLRTVLGVQPGWPALHVLDSTVPDAVRSVAPPLERTLFLLASKSGTTIEPNVLAAHYASALLAAGVSNWASHFVAITDPGTSLAERAGHEGFRDVFLNPPDIGGRYSALSFFGLVPAALMGQDVEALVAWGVAMLDAATPGLRGVEANPAAVLGLAMGAAARSGRDKLMLVAPPELAPFGLWVEQLVAESTGKHGVGIVPVVGEPVGEGRPPAADRLVVELRSASVPPRERPAGRGLAGAAPTVALDLAEPAALGAEFVRWEIATALAGALLGINPFDEPNVQQAKDATTALLGHFRSHGVLPVLDADAADGRGIRYTLTAAARERLGVASPDLFLTLLGPGDYLGLLAYAGPNPSFDLALQAFRSDVHGRTGLATTSGTGPRYLHSTGQLHKGGANTGVFVLVTTEPAADLPVPGESFSFGTLAFAQALGDFQSLDSAGRRALHVHLPAPDTTLLEAAAARLLAPLPRV